MAYVGEFEVRGYLTDSAAGTFRPTDPITRAELINILSNMVDTLVKETTTVTKDVSGSLLISAADGATLKGIRIGGDLILAPGVTKDVTLVDCVIQGNIRNYGTGEVRFEAPQITPGEHGYQALRGLQARCPRWTAPLNTAARPCPFTGTVR